VASRRRVCPVLPRLTLFVELRAVEQGFWVLFGRPFRCYAPPRELGAAKPWDPPSL